MKTIKLNAIELRALETVVFENCCSSGCAWEEMQTTKIDCGECPLTKALHSIQEKIN